MNLAQREIPAEMKRPGRIFLNDTNDNKPQFVISYLDGKLAVFADQVRGFMREYNLATLIETGAGIGQSAVFAMTLPFDRIWSCEVDALSVSIGERIFPELYTDPRVSMFHESSEHLLARLPALSADEGILFFLDAHFPGSHLGDLGAWDEFVKAHIPLQRELELIRQHRPASRDVIMIDDLWLWLDGEYEWGLLPEDTRLIAPKTRGIGFIEDIFGGSHSAVVHKQCGGWLSLEPYR